ncbi:hypothetical protein [Deinococcus deserti]|uniref:Uncharacterized protein n=1 Tax=Deinococcus deserti (strain DSM 17065 / CIP 109153 / LMG 22923 / VCD115) TaxID=546414 RepID=C1CZQ2_DEIDV|nr:hypothetical protein [Deinococcus deserti]ACO47300.2 hypothetical protein Deide_22690 [Deinococcus deserti VCD115]
MNHTRTWSDVYGSACATFEGRAGGHRWLVAAPSDLAAGLPAVLEAVDGKGQVQLLVHDGLTPLLAAIQALEPRGVIVVAPLALAAGPAVTVQDRTVDNAGAASYLEGGSFPAWESPAWSTQDAADEVTGECPAASAVASLNVPVLVTVPARVGEMLERWMDLTPHGR